MKIRWKLITFTILLCHLMSHAHAEPEQIELLHPNFDEPLKFNVTLPENYSQEAGKSYLMLFDFHPRAQVYLEGMHDWLSHNGEWPWLETIIVTPVAGNRVGMLFDETGKTTPLLDFFESTLFPEIDKKYRTNGFRIMSGFRVNATLVLSALINKPDMIDAYFATSPELGNDYASILSTASEKLAKLNDKPRYLLFSHGSSIKEDHQFSSYKKLQEILNVAAPSQLDWRYKHFAENYFMSLPLLSTIFGIEGLFDDIHRGLAPDSEISQKGVSAIKAHYEYLSKSKYGFEISPSLSIEKLAFYQLAISPDKGLEVLQDNLRLYPDDTNSHHNLAKAYAILGDYKSAVLHQQQAVKLTETMLTWHQKRQQKFLDEYKQKLTMTN